jgi:hypothetical protein
LWWLVLAKQDRLRDSSTALKDFVENIRFPDCLGLHSNILAGTIASTQFIKNRVGCRLAPYIRCSPSQPELFLYLRTPFGLDLRHVQMPQESRRRDGHGGVSVDAQV